jgi:adenylate cyclase
VAEEILKNPDKVDLGGKLQNVTVMFTEVVNFEELLNSMDPNNLISMLNEYFSLALDTVFEYDGTLDKFIGDNVMAFWGAPLEVADGELKAVRCALSLQEKIAGLNNSWRQMGKPLFHVCIGINSGRVVAGNIGSIRRMEYTVIGDTVNVASRIKSLSKNKNIPILLSETTYDKVRDLFAVENRFQAAVKGKTQNITVYQLSI